MRQHLRGLRASSRRDSRSPPAARLIRRNTNRVCAVTVLTGRQSKNLTDPDAPTTGADAQIGRSRAPWMTARGGRQDAPNGGDVWLSATDR
jgi:hypothetical protein